MIRNPILKGFNPDPSIVRVGDDYYIATSTFEWYPGVQIHHSRDLVNWRLLTRPLRRASQLNMLGDADSCGVWAPCLSHDGNQFYLIYTDVKRYGRTSVGGAAGASLRDFHNYMVTCETIDGDWSDPVYMNSSGFDPSLFHDDDGRKWFVNMLWDHRPGQNRFAGIVAQEYSPREHKLIGERVNIFKGTPLGLTEAPHLYQAGWLLLPDHRGRRHGLEPCGNAVPVEKPAGAIRTSSRHLHTERPQSPGRAAATRRPCRSGGDAIGRYLHGLSLWPPLEKPRPLHPGPRNGDPEDAVGQGWLALHPRQKRRAGTDDACARPSGTSLSCRAGPGRL